MKRHTLVQRSSILIDLLLQTATRSNGILGALSSDSGEGKLMQEMHKVVN